jgi:hypothetical protein
MNGLSQHALQWHTEKALIAAIGFHNFAAINQYEQDENIWGYS